MADIRRSVLKLDRHHIEPAQPAVDAVFVEISFRDGAYLFLLFLRDRLFRRTVCYRMPRFHFDEDQVPVFFRHDIDFTAFKPVVSIENFKSTPLEKPCCKFLPCLPLFSEIAAMHDWTIFPLAMVYGNYWKTPGDAN